MRTYLTCQIDCEKSQLLWNQPAFLISQASSQDSGFIGFIPNALAGDAEIPYVIEKRNEPAVWIRR